MFARKHHQAIAQVLSALDGDLLARCRCYFGGGTAIAMRYGEFRESVDIDFLVSSKQGYRQLRQLASPGLANLFVSKTHPFGHIGDTRADQYGIRTMLEVVGRPIKFEIVLEGRIALETQGSEDFICGVATLSPLDMASSKLLANSDRWLDDGAFNRDVIDLAMMNPGKALLEKAVAKSSDAYGESVQVDLGKAIDRLENRDGWLERCMESMAINLPQAVVWKHLRQLKMWGQSKGSE
ncbi:nucleotidyl transferase AbiEii/AbiGii toxin family protein [Marinihelvus fidelis]|uniref:Nucleotidyl transferase AbiEii/AbiGii toxin family protein n=1 Tax=Marinihelvus fidelis TaxID=2613842 RepID=A0A5N0T967_9GAMM|nr:nucleotidyl transferase AbiEii/AbiGii toxin family protein [Marinihelvus fidelis]KAA9131024.1 nucleotidyl transferase AbiEii/AbiGii toxin family protein [Marinihelvus fidelis]